MRAWIRVKELWGRGQGEGPSAEELRRFRLAGLEGSEGRVRSVAVIRAAG